MDTSKMKHLEKMDSVKSYQLLQLAKKLGKVALEVQDTLEKSFLREQIVEVVEAHYDLGRVVDAFEIFGGYINRSFGIVVEKEGVQQHYFLRKYKLDILDQEIQFEHAMITHSIANGLSICAALIFTREGATFVKPAISRNKFAIYKYLCGEDKYSWDNPIMEDEEYASSAEVLSTFHNATRNFDPQGLGRAEAKILDLVPTLAERFLAFAKNDSRSNTKFYRFFLGNLDSILAVISLNTINAEDAKQLIVNAIHCDFHPGNLKFKDNRAVGVFDFDWAKIDVRLFDVCFAMVYNASRWGGREDGMMLIEKCAIFLQSYQNTLIRISGLSPLTAVELRNFPVMMAMANLYLLNWSLTAFFNGGEVNDYEYLAYLKHSVRQMEWIEQHKYQFADLAASIEHVNP